MKLERDKMITGKRSLSDYLFFFDFDNTITHFDVFDDIVKRFSVDKEWIAWERAWKEGKIGSKKCLIEQLKSVRITRKGLSDYLSKIKVDRYFLKLISAFKKQGINPVILSDSFSLFIESVLRHNRIKGIKLYSNKLRLVGDRLIPSFPLQGDETCLLCAHCKKKTLLDNAIDGKIITYIGDGRSDICPSIFADLVFAKGNLAKELRRIKKDCIPINDLRDVRDYFKRIIPC
ncbi:MAG: MtnX-like HAD-IB family phosphatase [Candidatus Omnitrophota bacterium]